MKEWIKKKWVAFKAFFTSNVLWSIIIVLCCAAAIVYLNFYYSCKPIVKDIIIPVLTAIIAGFVVSIVIDIKKQVTGIQDLIVKSFTENTFLEHLSEEQIQKLRKDALKQLIKSNYPEMQDGLVEKDNEIFHALTNPYYESFRETNLFYKNERFAWDRKAPEEAVLFKNVDVQYTLKSPNSENVPTTVDLSICKSLMLPTSIGNESTAVERIWKLKQFTVSIDGGEDVALEENLKYQTKDLSAVDDYYNKSVRTYYTGTHSSIKGSSNEKTGIFLTFKKSVRVHINYDIYLPVEDNHYTSRLKYPAKSFAITCVCKDDPNVKFYGELLGTFMDSSELKITHPDDSILTIEASNWLLPKNGVVIMLCEKSKKM